jgi:hypothetical protein
MNDEPKRVWKAEIVNSIEKLFHLMALSEPMKGRWVSEETVWRQWLFKERKKETLTVAVT